jgi:hypothetical protein
MMNYLLLGSRRFDALNLVISENSEKAHVTKYRSCNNVAVKYEIVYAFSVV